MSAWGFADGLLVALRYPGGLRSACSRPGRCCWPATLALHGTAVLREASLITAGGTVQTMVADRGVAAATVRGRASCRGRTPTGPSPSTRGRRELPPCAVRPRPWSRRRRRMDAGASPAAPRAPAAGARRARANRSGWSLWRALARGDARERPLPGRRRRGPWTLSRPAATRRPLLDALHHSVPGIGDAAARRQAENLTAWITAAGRPERRGAPGPVPRPHPLRFVAGRGSRGTSSVYRHRRAAVGRRFVVAGIVYRGLYARPRLLGCAHGADRASSPTTGPR